MFQCCVQERTKGVIVDANRLQQFFFKYEFDNFHEQLLRERLLQEVPLSCNFMFNPTTRIAEVVGNHCDTVTSNLCFQLSLRFSTGCEIQLSFEFYDQLYELGKLQSQLLNWPKPRTRPPLKEKKGFWALFSYLGLFPD